MKTGKSISELAAEIERQQSTKRDFIADTREVRIDDGRLVLRTGGDETSYPVRQAAHRQIAQRVGIPAKYYDRLREEAPALLADNVNHWFKEKPERRMVRTLDGEARAFLSDRYQRIDNAEVAEVTLPVLADVPGLNVVSTEITESKLYIKAVTDRVRAEVKVGDEVQAGVVISNSEIGAGALVVQPLIYRLVCLNGMVSNSGKLRRHHVGARASTREDIYELLSDETRQADDKAILLKVRDVVRASLDQVFFDKNVAKLREAAGVSITGNPVKAVEVLTENLGLANNEGGDILRHLIDGGDLSKWGVANAVTRLANYTPDYDRASELEMLGGKVIDLAPSAWREIAEAA
jgi:hypothetical protein